MDVMVIGETASRLRCASCPIRERAICARCNEAELARLDAIKSYRDIPAGAEIMGAGEDVGFVASIVSGVVKLLKTLPDGRTQMVGLLFPSDFVGPVRRAHVEHDAVAATPVTLCVFQRRPFDALLNGTPALERRLLEMTLDELDAARDWLLLLGRKTAREKVASFLVLLARRTTTGQGAAVVDLPVSRAEIADYLGLTVETVSRQLTKLRADGIVRLDGARRVIAPDLSRLQAIAEGDG